MTSHNYYQFIKPITYAINVGNMKNLKPNIVIISCMPCQLKCCFCMTNQQDIPTNILNITDFKSIINECICFGIQQFDLTPIVGDIFLDPMIYDKLQYLKDRNIYYEYVTNLLSLHDDKIEMILNNKNSECAISIYGWDEKSYKNTTNVDMYKPFFEKLSKLKGSTINKNNIRLYMRCCNLKDMPDTPMKKLLYNLINNGAILECAELNNKNWGGHLDIGESIEKTGLCHRLIWENGIYPNGDVTLCNCWDWSKQLIIGNVYKTSLNDIYDIKNNPILNDIIKNQIKSEYDGPCENCNDFQKLEDIKNCDWFKPYKILFSYNV